MKWGILSLLMGVCLCAYTFIFSSSFHVPSSWERAAPFHSTKSFLSSSDNGETAVLKRTGAITVVSNGSQLGNVRFTTLLT